MRRARRSRSRTSSRPPRPRHGVDSKPEPVQPTTALVSKTLSEQHLGGLSVVRLYSGEATPGQNLVNPTRGRSKKLGPLYHLVGKKRLDRKSVKAGDIFAAVKL